MIQFVFYLRPSDCKVDWDADVDVTDDVRRALDPQDPAVLRAGRLRRSFIQKAPTPGRRSAHVLRAHPPPAPVRHPAGARVFATVDEACFWVEAVDEET